MTKAFAKGSGLLATWFLFSVSACHPVHIGTDELDSGTDAPSTSIDGRDQTMSSDARINADASAPSACDFSTQYDYGFIGGLRVSIDRSVLGANNSYRHTRTLLRDPAQEMSCMPPVPSCGTANVITAADIESRDLLQADVKTALAQSTPPLYGYDARPGDGSVLEFKRADGRGFLVGGDCSAPQGKCVPIPTGIQQLRKDLLALDTQQLSTAECQTAGFPTMP